MRAKATVAFHNGNYKELYSILETREFESRCVQSQSIWIRNSSFITDSS